LVVVFNDFQMRAGSRNFRFRRKSIWNRRRNRRGRRRRGIAVSILQGCYRHTRSITSPSGCSCLTCLFSPIWSVEGIGVVILPIMDHEASIGLLNKSGFYQNLREHPCLSDPLCNHLKFIIIKRFQDAVRALGPRINPYLEQSDHTVRT